MDDALNVKRIAIEPQGRKISVVSDKSAYPSSNNLERRAVNIVGLWVCKHVNKFCPGIC
jgi:hypothetical protein